MTHDFAEPALSDNAILGLIEEIRMARTSKSPETLTLLNAVSTKIRLKQRVLAAEKRKIENIYTFMCR